MKLRLLLVTYGLANAVLYSIMLPLWEGFDEPFHFGYVQSLANGRGIPDPRTSPLSREIGSSLLIAPASSAVQHNLPQVTTYSQYFSLPRFERAELQRRLRALPPDSRSQGSEFLNYEAHHPPLAYATLALPEWALARIPLPARVLILRIIGAVFGTLLLYFGAAGLFSELGMPAAYQSAAMFCVFSCQMVWATIAHVANDWLAVPIAVCLLAMAVRYWKKPSLRVALAVAGLLSAGLLTKAYFVALVPAALAVCLLLRRWKELCVVAAMILVAAGPWYARNVVRYGVVTGMQESRAGIGPMAVIHAGPALNWPAVINSSVRSALWTGNNTFQSFSTTTLSAMMAGCLIGLILWTRGRHGSTEWITVAYCALFLGALAYITVASHIYTRGAAMAPSPWYSPVLLAPVLGLVFLGCSRSPRLGRPVAAILMVLFGYVLIATYAGKLIPLYGGYEGRTSLASLIALYSKRLPVLADNLDLLALAPARIILSLVAMVAALAVAQMAVLIRSIFGRAGQVLRN